MSLDPVHPATRRARCVPLAAVALLLAALVSVSSRPAAQDGPAPAAPSAAADPSALHVTGLTDLNSGPVEIALEGLAHPIWHCVACNLTEPAPVPCPLCRNEMISIQQTLLQHVLVDRVAGTIHFDVEAGQRVSLSEIQAAIKRYKIVIAPEQQFIPHETTLRIGGLASSEAAVKLATTLAKDTAVFERVQARFIEADKVTELTVRCVGWPARPVVEQALAKANPDSRLDDIVWSGPARGAASR